MLSANKIKKSLKTFLLLFVGVFSLLILYYSIWNTYYIKNKLPLKKNIIITIPQGLSSYKVTRFLYNKNIIDYPELFLLSIKLLGVDKKLKAGEYFISKEISHGKLIQLISQGINFHRKITIPEGLTTKQIFNLLESNTFLTGKISLNISEGVLMPSTYYFLKGQTRDSILIKMKSLFQNTYKNLIYAKPSLQIFPLQNFKEILILASIVEAECKTAEERRKIAGVFLNRLKAGMNLQSCASALYNTSFPRTHKNIKQAIKNNSSPYNTYLYPGLPPTPICNPSPDTIKATLNPEKHQYYYFVLCGRKHLFSKSYKEHLKNIKHSNKHHN